ncbi:hypothetical protein FisN_3Lu402 [Fistulifera solaris]|uniref:Uncharacterized protein n=1 Tax=Fistulifera solaris TaxID=1519565 RepID=A0A1Z5J8N6_FISSO|nr:hypothetical protein FisN_3Lu402 [Fistulifera solaris]|eukprot:GAX10178.1 hypothetical protein FisN_3Lu402 [Fistulifera solaris]
MADAHANNADPNIAAPVAAPFALSPGLSSHQVIDFSTREGSRLYEMATKQIGDERFDCDPGRMRSFIEGLSIRASNFGWGPIFNIPDNIEAIVQNTTNLLSNYGDITLEHIQDHARTYISTPSRAAQDSYMAANCLISSLSPTAIDRITIWRDQYTINGIPSGPCLFKVIIRETYIDTNATVTHIRTQLSSLDQYLPKIQLNITKMNQQVKQLLEGLAARGETTNDLLANLFKGYKAASDRTFVNYILKKEEDYHEGLPMTPDHLMNLADNKYKTLVQLSLWNAPSPEEEKILTLEAKLQKLESKKKTENKPKHQVKGKPQRNRNTPKPDWMSVPPKDDEPKQKTVEKSEYFWCDKHNSWGKHKMVDCRQANIRKPGTSKPEAKKERLVKALAALLDDSDSEQDDNDEEYSDESDNEASDSE